MKDISKEDSHNHRRVFAISVIHCIYSAEQRWYTFHLVYT
jgi:hypothetical protein